MPNALIPFEGNSFLSLISSIISHLFQRVKPEARE